MGRDSVNIVLIEDDSVIRLVLKNLLYSSFRKEKLNIYTCSNGMDGLGYLYVVHPEIIVIDATLPQYGGLEIIEYVRTNKVLNESSKKVVVLTAANQKLGDLPSDYVVLDKDDSDFLDRLINEISSLVEGRVEDGSRWFRFVKYIASQAYRYAHLSNQSADMAQKGNGPISKAILRANWIFYQVITTFFLSILYFLISRGDKDLNVPQRKDDLRLSRVRAYPALAVTLTFTLFLCAQVVLVSLSSYEFFNFFRSPAKAATYTWDGGGATENWSECTNWSTDVCPTSADSVIFDGTSSKNSTVDSSFGGTITAVSINAGYSGVVTQGRALIMNGAYTQSAGTYSANSFNFDANSTVTLNSGAIFTASSGNTNLGNAVTIDSAATFNNNSGIVIFDGSSSAVIACGNVTFNTVQITSSSSRTFNSDCTLPVGNNYTTTASGFIQLYGTLSGTGTFTKNNGSMTASAGSVFSGFSGLAIASLIVVDGDFSSYTSFVSTSSLIVNGTIVLPPSGTSFGTLNLNAAANVTAPSGTMTITGGINFNASSTFNHNNGTVSFTGSSGTVTCGGKLFNLVTFNNSGSKTISSSCTIPLGNNPTLLGNGGLTVAGTLSGTGTLTFPTGSLFTLNSGASFSGFSSISGGGLTVSGATLNLSGISSLTLSGQLLMTSGSVTLPPVADINGTLSMSAGTFTASSSTLNLAGALTISGSAVFNHNSGTIIFDGSTATLNCNSVSFNQVIFSNTGVKTISSTCTIALGNNPTVGVNNSGGLTVNGNVSGSGTLTAMGILTVNSGGVVSGFSNGSMNSITIAGGTFNTSIMTGIAATTVAVSSGSITLPPIADLTSVSVSGGSMTASSNTMSVSGSFTISGSGSFNHNGGVLTFDGISGSINCNNSTFNLVSFNHTSTKTVASSCSLPLGGDAVVTAAISLQGTLSGSGDLTIQGDLTVNSTGVLSGFESLYILEDMIVSGPTLNLSGYSGLDIAGTLTFSSGTLTLAENSAFGDFTFSGGNLIASAGTTTLRGQMQVTGTTTFDHNNGTIHFDNTAYEPIDCENFVFNHVTFGLDSILGIANNCSLPVGNDPVLPNGAINLYRYDLGGASLTGTGTLTKGGDTLYLAELSQDPGGFFSGFDSLNIDNLTVSTTTVTDLSGSTSFNSDVMVEVSSHLMLPATSTVSQLVINYNGTLTAPSDELIVTGDLTNSGIFNHNNGTVIFDGGATILTGNYQFNNIEVLPNIATFQVLEGSVITVEGMTTIAGTENNHIDLVSVTPGQPWYIDPQGSRNIQYVDVSDSVNNSPTAIQLLGTGSNLGNNVGWNFGIPVTTDLGEGAVIDGEFSVNTAPVFAFAISDEDSTDTVQYRIQIDDSEDFSTPVVDFTSAPLAQGSYTFTVGQAPSGGTYAVGNEGQVLGDSTYYWRVGGYDPTLYPVVYSTANEGEVAFGVDTIPPVGELFITDNSGSSNIRDIVILIPAIDTGSGVAEIMISEGEEFIETEWEQYEANLEYRTTATGSVTINVRLRDAVGNLSEVYSETVLISNSEPLPPEPEQDPEPEPEPEPVPGAEPDDGEEPAAPANNGSGRQTTSQPQSIIGRAGEAIVETTGRVVEEWEEGEYDLVTSGVATAASAGYILLFIPEIPGMALRFWIALLNFLKSRKRESFGIVYDAQDKAPLNNVIVRVYDDFGRLVDTDVTRYNGVYNLYLDNGRYRIDAVKTGYRFPARTIKTSTDGIYQSLYLGGVFSHKKDYSVDRAVPLDRAESGWSTVLVNVAQSGFVNALFIVLRILLVLGMVLSGLVLITSPSWLNFTFFLLYLIPVSLLIIQSMLKSGYTYGVVRSVKGNRLAGVEITLIEEGTDKTVQKVITDEQGRYRIVSFAGIYRLEFNGEHKVVKGKVKYTINKKLDLITGNFKLQPPEDNWTGSTESGVMRRVDSPQSVSPTQITA
ncbi:MAG: response regulator [Candidatus Dojkabacteria bacterium]|nr:MAG: response regulator [Candidatus Dojkabacteria bacterium]